MNCTGCPALAVYSFKGITQPCCFGIAYWEGKAGAPIPVETLKTCRWSEKRQNNKP